MQRLWWILLLVETCLLVQAVVQRGGFQRRHEPIPWHIAGTVWSTLAMLFLVASYLVGLEHPVAIAALVGSLACLALGIGQAIAAARRRA